MKTSFLALVLGAIATSGSITACSTTAQSSTGSTDSGAAKQMAQEIVTSQESEIKQMQQWKQAWYKQ